jgi:hypothetical protein
LEDADRLFAYGRANPHKFGWSIRSSAGKPPVAERLASVARLLEKPVSLVDADGYECELIGAATGPDRQIAFVESRAKDVGFNRHGANQRHIDISIRVHQVDSTGERRFADIESYNPFFGCDVRFFEWVGPTAVLIYREKHWTFACRLGDVWPPRFVKIEDRWIINGDTLGFIGYKVQVVGRLRFTDLEPLEPISVAEAKRVGLDPIG